MPIMEVSELSVIIDRWRDRVFEDFSTFLNGSIEDAILRGRSSVFISYSLLSYSIVIRGKGEFRSASFSPYEVPPFLKRVKREALKAGYRVDGSCRFLKCLRISWDPDPLSPLPDGRN